MFEGLPDPDDRSTRWSPSTMPRNRCVRSCWRSRRCASVILDTCDIAGKWLDWKAVEPRVKEYQALIEADVKVDGRKLYSFDSFSPAALEAFFRQRRAFLLP